MPRPAPKVPARTVRKPPNRFIPLIQRVLPNEYPWQRNAWLFAAVLLVPLVYYLQQFTRDLRGQTLESVPRQIAERETPDDPGISGLTIASKAMVKLWRYTKRLDEDERPSPKHLDEIALTRVDRLRIAIVSGEVEGAPAALNRIDDLVKDVEPAGDMAHELVWLRKAYADGPDTLPEEARQSLVDRHGWFGELALIRGRPPGDRARAEVVGGGSRLIAIETTLALGAILSFIVGIILLFVVVGSFQEGNFQSLFDEGVGGLIHLETFVLFAGGFLFLLGMGLVAFGFNFEGTPGAAAMLEVLLWSLVGVLLWPAVRKIPWRQFRIDIGLHSGEGVGKEIACGVIVWLISVPVGFAVALLIHLVFKDSGDDSPSGKYPLFNPPPGGTWGALWLGTLSAVVWAPFLEEVIFRGCLYRYLRPTLHWGGAVLVTSAVFGFIHPYTTAGLLSVGIMGIGFGLLREWRGSLIAPMTCHFLHNASISLFTIAFIAAID